MIHLLHLELDKIKKQGFPKILCFALLLCLALPLSGKKLQDDELAPLRPLNKRMWKDLRRGTILSLSQVKTKKKRQRLNYYAAGLHPRPCHLALRKLSRYEHYQNFISFIHSSQYDAKTQEMKILLKHRLLPFPLSMHISLSRITSPGRYPFRLLSGMLKGMEGKIQVSHYNQNQCFIELSGIWEGAVTKFGDTVFEIFTTTLGKLGMKKLFRISRI